MKPTTLNAVLFGAFLALSNVALAKDTLQTRVVDVNEVKKPVGGIKCYDASSSTPRRANYNRPAARKATVSVRGFGAEEIFQEQVERNTKKYSFFSTAKTCEDNDTGKTVGYEVFYDFGGDIVSKTFASRPERFLTVDRRTGQVVAGVKGESSPPGNRVPSTAECVRLYAIKNDRKARAVCGWLAEHGDPVAQNKIANLWFDGRGGRRSTEEALKWDLLGARQGHGRSMNNLGWMFENGKGVNMDTQKAFLWYTKSANVGDVCGQNSLGHLYAQGVRGLIEPNYQLAIEYFEKAIQNKYTDAKNCLALANVNLGEMYEGGKGVNRRSKDRALSLYSEAVNLGNRDAEEKVRAYGGTSPSFVEGTKLDYYNARPSIIYEKPSDEELQRQNKPEQIKKIELDEDPGMGRILAKQLPESPVKNRNGIAIIISNQKYDAKDINAVSYASNDKALMAVYAKKTLGYSDVQALENMSKGELEALFGTEKHKGRLFEDVEAKGSFEGSKPDVFIYYSGHGAPGDDRMSYLVPRDASPTQMEITGYSLNVLVSNLQKLNANKIVLMTEACFSGMSAGGTLVPRSSALVIRPRKINNTASNILTIAASKSDQVASWDDTAKLGLMTRYFIEGVIEGADKNNDGKVVAKELEKYLGYEVSRAARKEHNRVQNPVINGPLDFELR